MRTDLVEAHAPNGRQIAFEVASGITAGASIMIGIIRRLYVATLFTLVTTALCGLAYPLLVTAAAQVLFPSQANGSLVERNGQVVGFQADWPVVLRPRLFLVASVGCGQGLRRRIIWRLEPGPDKRGPR